MAKDRLPPRYIYKYFSNYLKLPDDLREKCLNALTTPYFHCSSAAAFNDPFELRNKIEVPRNLNEWGYYYDLLKKEGRVSVEKHLWLKDISNNKLHHNRQFKEVADRILIKTRDSSKICCFSEVMDSILMWSHYASQHTGYCLKIDTEAAEFKANLKCVKYSHGDRFTPFSVRNIGVDDFEVVFFHKHNGWKYEKEWRFIYGYSQYDYRKEAISEVYLGVESDAELQEGLKGIFPDAVFKKASIAERSYKLNFNEC